MDMEEIEIEALEREFPTLSGVAFKAARDRVLASGQSVLQSENGIIFEVFPDGRRIEVKKIAPPIHYPLGTVFHLK